MGANRNQKQNPRKNQGGTLSVAAKKKLEAAKKKAQEQETKVAQARVEAGLPAEIHDSSDGEMDMSWLERLNPELDKAAAPHAEQAKKLQAELEEKTRRHDNAYVFRMRHQAVMKLAARTEGHYFRELLQRKEELNERLNQTRVIDGVKVPRALFGTDLKALQDQCETEIKQIKQQWGIVIAADLGLDIDEAYNIIKADDEVMGGRPNDQKGK